MNDVSAFFGKGYKKKEKLPEVKKPEYEIKGNVAVNIMGDIYQADKKIEIMGGKVIIDGFQLPHSKGDLPNTSGTWIKVVKGKIIENSILTIVKSCDTMERS